MDNDFTNSPSVGSNDAKPTTEELQTRLILMEQRLNDAEKKQTTQQVEKKPKKKLFKKARRFFQTFIRPILDFLPKFLKSIADLRSTSKKVMYAWRAVNLLIVYVAWGGWLRLRQQSSKIWR